MTIDGLVPNHPKGNSPRTEKISVALNKTKQKTATVGPVDRNMVIIINIAPGVDQGVNNTQMVISIKTYCQ